MGGAGFVGTNLIKRLLKDEHEVHAVDNYSTGFKHNHQDGCTYHEYDLASERMLSIYVDHSTYPYWREDEFDLIFNVAALARIQPSLKNPLKTIRNNFNSALHTLEWARDKETPVVFAGSSTLHHGLWGSPYAWSKYGGEQLCELYNKVYDLPTAICRFYNVYGEHQLEDGAYATVVGIFEKQYREGKPLTITDRGEQRRDFTHIDDIIDAMIKVVDKNKWGFTFELGRGKNYSIKELVLMISEKSGGKVTWNFIPEIKGEMRETLCQSEKAREILEWEPKVALENWIKEKV